jgi:hypothetical protein
MKRRRTVREPSVAVALLQLFCRDEALVGDILEEYAHRQSRAWLWRQVGVAVIFSLPYGMVHRARTSPKMQMPIGGISFVVMVALITIVAPGAWWLVATGAAGGILLAVILVAMARRRPVSAGRKVLLDR